jgi:hypothetical protein
MEMKGHNNMDAHSKYGMHKPDAEVDARLQQLREEDHAVEVMVNHINHLRVVAWSVQQNNTSRIHRYNERCMRKAGNAMKKGHHEVAQRFYRQAAKAAAALALVASSKEKFGA